ncbi:type VI secretion ATPase, ClpV1 family [Serratia fonticola]|uniref:Type VI secretion ATPase, ClpV1 family n=1 Tax=Serratia fonticola TaxID=47917 RepID=A0A4U9UPS3_SERFO|nr:type VI secretion ATPase, ClpV1 family [Serratia fonticola]
MLDTAAARVAINLTSAPRQVSALKTQLHQQAMEIQMLEREQRLNLSQPDERLSVLQQQRAEIEQQLADLNASWQTQQQLVQQIIALRAELLTQEENATEEQAINLAALVPSWNSCNSIKPWFLHTWINIRSRR